MAGWPSVLLWAALSGPGGPTHPHTRLLMPSSSPSQLNSTRLVEGCFCPEGTTSYAPGFDVCVDLCGRLPAAWPLPSPSRG